MTMSIDEVTQNKSRTFWDTAKDYVQLTKPGITRMCVLMTLGGMFLASNSMDGNNPLSYFQAFWVVVGTAFSVGSANTLNMWLERKSDRQMKRTKKRPLADERISSAGAFWFGIIMGLLSVPILTLASNFLTALIGLFGIVSYVWVYTPMKYRAPIALAIGSIPGAVPPLMGWTALTGSIDAPGVLLFLVLYIWQMPHFIGISVVRKIDYESVGIRTVAGVRGYFWSKIQAILWAIAILPISLALVYYDVASLPYAIIAALVGLWYVYMAVRGPWPDRKATSTTAPPGFNKWGQQLFIASLIYLPVLVMGLALDVVL